MNEEAKPEEKKLEEKKVEKAAWLALSLERPHRVVAKISAKDVKFEPQATGARSLIFKSKACLNGLVDLDGVQCFLMEA